MRSLFLIYLLLFMGAVAFGQNQVEFLYDNAGNRISRQTVTLFKSATLSEKTAIAEEKMGERTVKLFPNPTYGLLTMDISHLSDNERVVVQVSDLNGRILMKEVQTSANFKIDLTAQPKGLYLLTAIIGTERKEWKIIKE
jgi:hypothetical protein